jgi:4-oxalocrotonate tautomerase
MRAPLSKTRLAETGADGTTIKRILSAGTPAADCGSGHHNRGFIMPLLRFDLIEGRSDDEIKKLLDVTHEVVLEALHVPVRDRYQVVHEHKASRIIFQDTGLGITRTPQVVLLQVTSRPREHGMKESFYRLLAERLKSRCGIAPSDLVVNFVSNTDEDWSFGLGRAQFLTGEL